MKEFLPFNVLKKFFRSKNFTLPNIAHSVFVALLVFLPFNVIFATFFTYKLHIPGVKFLKE